MHKTTLVFTFLGGTVLGAALTLQLTLSGDSEPTQSPRETLPWTLSEIDEVCRYELSGRAFSDGHGFEHDFARRRWSRFVEGVDLIADTLQENSLVCVQDLELTTSAVAVEVCRERENQNLAVRNSHLRSIGQALQAKYPGSCPQTRAASAAVDR